MTLSLHILCKYVYTCAAPSVGIGPERAEDARKTVSLKHTHTRASFLSYARTRTFTAKKDAKHRGREKAQETDEQRRRWNRESRQRIDLPRYTQTRNVSPYTASRWPFIPCTKESTTLFRLCEED